MIPSEVQPAYEPAVVERYRFETRVSAQASKQGEEETQHFLGVSFTWHSFYILFFRILVDTPLSTQIKNCTSFSFKILWFSPTVYHLFHCKLFSNF